MSTACYLYAIIPAPPQEPATILGDTVGLADRPLYLITAGGLAAVVSAWGADGKSPLPVANPADVLRHEAVIEAMLAVGPTLPVRFGSILADPGQVRQLLATRQAAFTTDLAHVAGRVEMGLRILWEPPTIQPTVSQPSELPPGRRYLQQKAHHRQQEAAVRNRGDALAHEIDQALRPWAVDQRLQVLQTPRLLLSAAYLVPQTNITQFQTTIDTLRQRYPALAFLVTGPWPAYHFISATGDTPALLSAALVGGAAKAFS